MNIRIKMIVCIVAAVLMASVLHAKRGDYNGTTAVLFTQVPLSTRALGMAGAFTALAHESESIAYNPAGITYVRKAGITVLMQDWIADTSLKYGSIIHPLPNNSTAALSVRTVGTPKLNNYNAWGEIIGKLNYSALSVDATYARLIRNHRFGITGRYFSENIDDNNKGGISFDVGWRHRINPITFNLFDTTIMTRSIWIGSAIKHLGTKIYGHPQRTMITLGAGYIFSPALLTAIDISKPVYIWKSLIDGFYQVNIGTEYNWREWIYGRFGIRLASNDASNITFGTGIKYSWRTYSIRLDYAFIPYWRFFNAHQISISFKMNGFVASVMSDEDIKKVDYYYKKALILYMKNDFDQSLEYLNKLLAIDPHHSAALEKREELRALQGSIAEPKKEWED